MASIFVSYSRGSGVVVRSLVSDFDALGHTVWFDQDLSGGHAWWNEILGRIRECDLFVSILDPESLDSTACQREYGYAADLGKRIMPILVSGAVSTNLLPPALSQIQFVDYRVQDRDAVLRLAKALGALPPPVPLPDPLPPVPPVPTSYLGNLSSQVDTAPMLSYEQQSALLVDLRRHLRDPATAGDARTLLERLRKRRDLFAAIAEEMAELIAAPTREPARGPQPQAAYYASGISNVAGVDAGPQLPTAVPAPKRIWSRVATGRNPTLATILSLLIVGLGQFYNGDMKKGAAMLIIALVLVVLVGSAGGLGWLGIAIWSAVDAYRVANGTAQRW